MAELEKVVDCALTERAKKKLARPGSRRGSEKTKQSAAEVPDGGETDATGEGGVIYLGHVPHGFYEEEMRKYFSQFGTVTKLKLYRSRKTGRSRGYAFIEFEFPEVAAIAAESMNNYLMFGKLLKCHVVEPGRVHRNMFKVSDSAPPSEQRTRRLAQRDHNRPRSVPEAQRRLARMLSRESRKRKRLAELGLDYQFPGYRGVAVAMGTTVKPTHLTFTEEEDSAEEQEEEGQGQVEGEAESE